MKPTISAYGYFANPWVVQNGDRFHLAVDGETVHVEDITEGRLIEIWICADYAGAGTGYILGSVKLLDFFEITKHTKRIDSLNRPRTTIHPLDTEAGSN